MLHLLLHLSALATGLAAGIAAGILVTARIIRDRIRRRWQESHPALKWEDYHD